MSDEPDKLSQSVKAITADTEQLLDALMEMIERMSEGNPRLLKSERKTIAKFAHILIDHLGGQVYMLKSHDEIRLRMSRTIDQWEHVRRLDIRLHQQQRQILNILRDMIEQKHYDHALDLIDSVLRGPQQDDEPDEKVD